MYADAIWKDDADSESSVRIIKFCEDHGVELRNRFVEGSEEALALHEEIVHEFGSHFDGSWLPALLVRYDDAKIFWIVYNPDYEDLVAVRSRMTSLAA